MSPIRQSLCYWAFARTLSPAELVAAAADIGYASVEMAPEEHWPRVRDAGLEIAIAVGHQSLTDGLNDPANHDRIQDELTAGIDKAADNGIPALIVFSGNRAGRSDREGADHTAAGLLRVKDHAEARGVTLCMELLNSRVDHPDYQCDRTEWGVQVCRAVDSPRVRLLYDIYHMQIMEGDLIRTIQTHHPWIGHYHTAGNPGRKDLDEVQEIQYPAVMRAIAGTGYQGFVGHEYSPKGDAVASMRAAFQLCDVS